MHRHGKDDRDSGDLRPASARLDTTPDKLTIDAAAAGRTEVLAGDRVSQLQRSLGNRVVSRLMGEDESPVREVVGSGGGSPLAPEVRADMEGRLGHDFGDVKVHTDGKAHDSATSVNAQAYTVGSNVVFQRDKYNPGSDAGRVMLAHELTHVVQQRSGPVEGTPTAGGIKVSDPTDRFEREASANAERVMSKAAPEPAPVSVSPTGVQREVEETASVQRAEEPGEEEEETAQGSFIQREAAPEEEQEETSD